MDRVKRLLDEMEENMSKPAECALEPDLNSREPRICRFLGEDRFEPASWPEGWTTGWYDYFDEGVEPRMEGAGFEQTPSIVVCRYSEEPFFFHRRISGEGDTWLEVDKRGSVTLLPTEAEMADLMQHHDIGHTRFGFDDTKDMCEVCVTDAMGRRVGTEVKVAVAYTVECPDGQMVGNGARLHVGDRITDEFSLTPHGRAHLTAFCISAGVDLPCGDDEASMAQWARAIVHARVGVLRALSGADAKVVGFVRSCVPADAPIPSSTPTNGDDACS